MRPSLTVANSGKTFASEPGETMLDVLLRHGVRVRYGCRRGKCSSCKHVVLDGDYDNSGASAYALLEEEREQGMTLLCQTYPQSDCTVELLIESGDEDGVRLPTPFLTRGRITAVTPVTPSMISVALELDDPLRFLPGQYLEIDAAGGGASRSYCIASGPMTVRRPELLVRRHPGGAFTALLDGAAREFEVRGPYGAMYLRPSRRPVVLVGWGAGIAPLLSITRYAGRQGWAAPVSLFHGAECAGELAFAGELTAWAAGEESFAYHPVVEEPARPGGFCLRSITTALNTQVIAGADVDVYVAGPAAFCEQIGFVLEARGLDVNRIFVERFFAASGGEL